MAKKNGHAEAPKETALATIGNYAVVKQDVTRLSAIIRQNLGGKGLDRFQLEKIPIPTGGLTKWQLPSLDGDKMVDEIVGVIVYFQDGRVYWKESFDETGGGSPPDCSSNNLEYGDGTPGGQCAVCPLSKFGTATRNGKQARGQACRETRVMFILLPDRLIPVNLTLPPTSLGSARKYMLRLASQSIPYTGVVTRITLSQDKSADGIKYSKAEFSVAGRLTEEEIARIEEIVKVLKPQMAAASDVRNVQQAEVSGG